MSAILYPGCVHKTANSGAMIHLWLLVTLVMSIIFLMTMGIIYVIQFHCHWTKEKNIKSIDTGEFLAWKRSVHQLATEVVMEDLKSRSAHAQGVPTSPLPVVTGDPGFVEPAAQSRSDGKVRFQTVPEQSSNYYDVVHM